MDMELHNIHVRHGGYQSTVQYTSTYDLTSDTKILFYFGFTVFTSSKHLLYGNSIGRRVF